METLLGQGKRGDVLIEQQTLNERIKLIRKLRWIGMEEQAKKLQSTMIRDYTQVSDSVIADCSETD